MSFALTIRNHDRKRPVNVRLLRQIAKALLQDLLQIEHFDLGLYLVATSEITHLNETFLHHKGSTDVITFDYSKKPGATCGAPHPSDWLHGEILVCLDEACVQARRFRTTWQSELVSYVIHGLLHLRGFKDHHPAHRRTMKREEARLLRELSRRFHFAAIAQTNRAKPGVRRHA